MLDEEVEGLLDEDEMGVIFSGKSPPFGIVVFPESLPFEGEDVWILMVGLLVFLFDDIFSASRVFCFLDDEREWTSYPFIRIFVIASKRKTGELRQSKVVFAVICV